MLDFRAHTGDRKLWTAFPPRTSADRRHETKWFEWTHPRWRERPFPTLAAITVIP